MQKPIGGRSVLAQKPPNSMLKTRTYLDPNRNSLQKPIEGLSASFFQGLWLLHVRAL